MNKRHELSTGAKLGSMKKLSLFILGAALTLCPAAKAQQQATVFLGSAASFAVLGGSAVTNTGNTVVNGDLGVWPGTSVTGFNPAGRVSGSIYAGTAVAQHAQASAAIAYNDAKGRTNGVHVLSAGNFDLGGKTYNPGLYKSTSLGLTGTVTLSGKGVYIFQMGTTLITGPGAKVILSNGADAADVFWQLGTSATLGNNTDFKGTILAGAQIAFDTGATLEGRAIAQTAVTLIDNTVTIPLKNTLIIQLPPAPPHVND